MTRIAMETIDKMTAPVAAKIGSLTAPYIIEFIGTFFLCLTVSLVSGEKVKGGFIVLIFNGDVQKTQCFTINILLNLTEIFSIETVRYVLQNALGPLGIGAVLLCAVFLGGHISGYDHGSPLPFFIFFWWDAPFPSAIRCHF